MVRLLCRTGRAKPFPGRATAWSPACRSCCSCDAVSVVHSKSCASAFRPYMRMTYLPTRPFRSRSQSSAPVCSRRLPPPSVQGLALLSCCASWRIAASLIADPSPQRRRIISILTGIESVLRCVKGLSILAGIFCPYSVNRSDKFLLGTATDATKMRPNAPQRVGQTARLVFTSRSRSEQVAPDPPCTAMPCMIAIR